MQNIIRRRKCVRPIEAVTKKCTIAGIATINSTTNINSNDGDNNNDGLCQNREKHSPEKLMNEENDGKRYTNAATVHKGVAAPKRAAKKPFSDNFPERAG